MSAEIDQIKERLDIAEIVGEYVQLKRAGRHYKGLCPFHSEKTPSFIVSPDRGIWHCFGSCSEGGDMFSFVQKMEGLDFPAALKVLAERAGVQLTRQQSVAARDGRVRQYDLLSLAARFYHTLLTTLDVGSKALVYLQERGLEAETLSLLQVGYAPQRWDTLQQFLRRHDFSEEELLGSGLVGRSDRGTLYDRFRGRIMFPIHDVQGRVVAFGGRITPWHETGNEGKYINSPETPIYEKRRIVYNLNRAKKVLRQFEPCLVVEGYMDVAMLVQAGVTNVVATSGTAFTREHVAVLKRYTNTLHFAFDGDTAGLQAAEHATREAVAAGMRVATILFPAGKDPADVVKDEPDQLQAYLQQTTTVVELLLRRLREADSAASRQVLLERLLPFVREVTNPVQQGEMVQQIAEALHIPDTVVVEQLAQLRQQWQVSASDATPGDGLARRLPPEQLLLGLLLIEPTLRATYWEQLEGETFLDAPSADLYKQMQYLAAQQPTYLQQSADELISQLPETSVPFAEGIRRVAEEHSSSISGGLRREVHTLVRVLKVTYLERRLVALQDQLTQQAAGTSGDMLREFQQVARDLSAAKAEG